MTKPNGGLRARSPRARMRRTGAWLAIGACVVTVGPAAGQIPDTFENLRVFDEDISRDELIGEMRQFSFALGVRCQYCHAGGDGISFEGVEFESDQKPTKRRARYMLEMTRALNTTLLAGVPERRVPNVGVECRTCHRGLPRPVMIDELLRTRIAEEGVEAAVARYRELRESGYGGWSYDFGEWVINDLAAEYQEQDPEIAAALLSMNSEFHPESISVWILLGQAEEGAGRLEGAIEAARRALEIDPDNRQARGMLERLGSEPGPV